MSTATVFFLISMAVMFALMGRFVWRLNRRPVDLQQRDLDIYWLVAASSLVSVVGFATQIDMTLTISSCGFSLFVGGLSLGMALSAWKRTKTES